MTEFGSTPSSTPTPALGSDQHMPTGSPPSDRFLHEGFVYTDPNVETVGYDDLAEYMNGFQQQVPGAGFVNRHVSHHHDVLLVQWDMTGPDGTVLGPGASFGRTHPDGRLASMTGFSNSSDDQRQTQRSSARLSRTSHRLVQSSSAPTSVESPSYTRPTTRHHPTHSPTPTSFSHSHEAAIATRTTPLNLHRVTTLKRTGES